MLRRQPAQDLSMGFITLEGGSGVRALLSLSSFNQAGARKNAMYFFRGLQKKKFLSFLSIFVFALFSILLFYFIFQCAV